MVLENIFGNAFYKGGLTDPGVAQQNNFEAGNVNAHANVKLFDGSLVRAEKESKMGLILLGVGLGNVGLVCVHWNE
jgi:hypothetical protein